MRCANCATENESGRKWCLECGAQLSVTCPNCGTANNPAAKFCGECGTTLSAGGATAAGASAAQAGASGGGAGATQVAEAGLRARPFLEHLDRLRSETPTHAAPSADPSGVEVGAGAAKKQRP